MVDWSNRAKWNAERIQIGWTVLDLGAGNCLVRQHLTQHAEYYAADKALGPSDIQVDFDECTWRPPKKYDTVIASGVIEYLHKPEEFIKMACKYAARQLLVQYREDKGNSIAWGHHLTPGAVCERVMRNGFVLVDFERYGYCPDVWELRYDFRRRDDVPVL